MKRMMVPFLVAFVQNRATGVLREVLHLTAANNMRTAAKVSTARRLAATTTTTTTTSSNQQSQLMQDILYRVRDVNRVPLGTEQPLEFQVNGLSLGKITHQNADLLCSTVVADKPIFELLDDKILTLTKHAGSTFESRTKAVEGVMEKLRDDGIVTGWRDEHYPVSTSFYDEPIFSMERSAVPLLGVLEYGVHINGLVRDGSGGGVKMWMARRAADKSKYPGMVDHLVAGGQPVGLSLMENVVKECMEEAGIPEELTRAGVRPAGAVSYETHSSQSGRITRAVLFNYDLYLPPDFVPKPMDGEVEEFFLWTVDEILESMAPDYPDPIKPNCYSVIIDYLLREGHLSPEIPGYLDVLRELRSGSCC